MKVAVGTVFPMRRTTVAPVLALVATVALMCAVPAAALAAAVSSTLLFNFADSRITESSGLGTSSYGDGIVYTHNDSGDTARFFAVKCGWRDRRGLHLAGSGQPRLGRHGDRYRCGWASGAVLRRHR